MLGLSSLGGGECGSGLRDGDVCDVNSACQLRKFRGEVDTIIKKTHSCSVTES